ncbi:hypothetical protein SD78_1950 [Bacillus badius]|nr:hypothetical protein SD78_1950 [Bacillus badius]
MNFNSARKRISFPAFYIVYLSLYCTTLLIEPGLLFPFGYSLNKLE